MLRGAVVLHFNTSIVNHSVINRLQLSISCFCTSCHVGSCFSHQSFDVNPFQWLSLHFSDGILGRAD